MFGSPDWSRPYTRAASTEVAALAAVGGAMGRDISTVEFTREDRSRYREKVKANLAALAQLVEQGRFETGKRMAGVELEVYLADADGTVTPINDELLRRIASKDFQTE